MYNSPEDEVTHCEAIHALISSCLARVSLHIGRGAQVVQRPQANHRQTEHNDIWMATACLIFKQLTQHFLV